MPFYIRVQQVDPPGLRLRSQSTAESEVVASEASGALLTVIESEQSAALKIGVNGQWIHVRDENQLEGYVAAWYVEAALGVIPPLTQEYILRVSGSLSAGLNIRETGEMDGILLRVAAAGERLIVQEPVEAAKPKLGVEGQWLQVKDDLGNVGYVAAWLVSEME